MARRTKREKSPKVNQRSLLIFLLVGAQLVCLLAGLFLFSTLLSQRLQGTLETAVLNNSYQSAVQAGIFIEKLGATDLRRGTKDWLRVQKLIEEFKLPNGGFITVIDNRNGELLCHPDLAVRPQMESPALTQLQTKLGSLPMGEADGTGFATMPDGNYLVAVRNMPTLGIRILAFQREMVMRQAVLHVLAPLLPVGLSSLLLITCLTLAMTWVIIKRYENRLADANENLEEEVQLRSKALVKTRNATIFGLAKLAESRDTDTGDHLDRIRSFVTILARRLQSVNPSLTDEYIETLGVASSLHDIGKVGIPDSVLLKPGRLDNDERAVMESHAQIGADCIAAIIERLGEDDFLTVAHEIALWHHEKFDGSGYPTKLNGSDIPISARIVALADVYDALISPRVYKRPMSHAQARQIILEGSGQHFDPAVVAAFLASEEKFIAITDALHSRIDEVTRPQIETLALKASGSIVANETPKEPTATDSISNSAYSTNSASDNEVIIGNTTGMEAEAFDDGEASVTEATQQDASLIDTVVEYPICDEAIEENAMKIDCSDETPGAQLAETTSVLTMTSAGISESTSIYLAAQDTTASRTETLPAAPTPSHGQPVENTYFEKPSGSSSPSEIRSQASDSSEPSDKS